MTTLTRLAGARTNTDYNLHDFPSKSHIGGVTEMLLRTFATPPSRSSPTSECIHSLLSGEAWGNVERAFLLSPLSSGQWTPRVQPPLLGGLGN